MHLNEFIIVVLVLNSMGQNQDTKSSTRISLDAIETWTNVGIALAKVDATSGDQLLFDAIRILSTAIPHLGSVLNSILDMINKPKNELDEIRQQLIQMNNHLFAIENKIDSLSQQITETSILSEYKSQAQRINLLEKAYQKHLHSNTEITKLELVDFCNRNDIMEYIYYVQSELTNSTNTLPLMSVMNAKHDLVNFHLWMKMLVGSVSQSMMLRTICIYAKYENHSDIMVTLEGDMADFENMSYNMFNVAISGVFDIKKKFFQTARNEIISYAKENRGVSHMEFTIGLGKQLSTKYFWRKWFALSYDAISGDENHQVTDNSDYVFNSFRTYGRNMQVVHTNNNDGTIATALSQSIPYDVEPAGKKYMFECKKVFEYVSNLIGARNYLGVINSAYDFGYYYGDQGIFGVESRMFSYVYNAVIWGERDVGYVVFAVAKEK